MSASSGVQGAGDNIIGAGGKSPPARLATKLQRHSTAALLIFLFLFHVLTLSLWYCIDHRPSRWDESHTLYISEHSYQNLKAGRVIAALDLHGVTGTKPGMVPFLSALSYFVVGRSPVVAAWLSNLVSLALLGYALIALSRLILDTPWPGLVAALWFQTIPIVMVWTGYYQPDLPLTAAAAFTVMLCVRLEHSDFTSRRDAILLAVAITLGSGIKHMYVAFACLPVAYLLKSAVLGAPGVAANIRRRWPVLAAVGAGSFAGVGYHLLNAHVLLEQLMRSRNAAATGGFGLSPSLWPIFTAQLLAPAAAAKLFVFAAGTACSLMIGRRRSLYVVLWLTGGWAGVALVASFPMSYYLLPLLPAFGLLGAGIFAADRLVASRPPWLAMSLRMAAICVAAFFMSSYMRLHLGSSNPVRLVSNLTLLGKSKKEIKSNPLAEQDYWSAGVVDGNQALLPYPHDWKIDEITGALGELVRYRAGVAPAPVALLFDYEWMSRELFRYAILASGLERRLVVGGPDLDKMNDPAAAVKNRDIVVVKSGHIFKDDFYALEWARQSQGTVDALLANGGALLKQSGLLMYRSFVLPDRSVTSIWYSPLQLLTFRLVEMLGTAQYEPRKDNLVSTTVFKINGDERLVLYEHPRKPPEVTGIRWTSLPVAAGTHLKFGVAMNPEVWGPDKGDGVEFQVDVWESGTARTIFSKYIDPKRNPADRKWFDYDIPLGVSGKSPVDIRLSTRPGPNSDVLYDHAGWSTPVLAP